MSLTPNPQDPIFTDAAKSAGNKFGSLDSDIILPLESSNVRDQFRAKMESAREAHLWLQDGPIERVLLFAHAPIAFPTPMEGIERDALVVEAGYLQVEVSSRVPDQENYFYRFRWHTPIDSDLAGDTPVFVIERSKNRAVSGDATCDTLVIASGDQVTKLRESMKLGSPISERARHATTLLDIAPYNGGKSLRGWIADEHHREIRAMYDDISSSAPDKAHAELLLKMMHTPCAVNKDAFAKATKRLRGLNRGISTFSQWRVRLQRLRTVLGMSQLPDLNRVLDVATACEMPLAGAPSAGMQTHLRESICAPADGRAITKQDIQAAYLGGTSFAIDICRRASAENVVAKDKTIRGELKNVMEYAPREALLCMQSIVEQAPDIGDLRRQLVDLIAEAPVPLEERRRVLEEVKRHATRSHESRRFMEPVSRSLQKIAEYERNWSSFRPLASHAPQPTRRRFLGGIASAIGVGAAVLGVRELVMPKPDPIEKASAALAKLEHFLNSRLGPLMFGEFNWAPKNPIVITPFNQREMKHELNLVPSAMVSLRESSQKVNVPGFNFSITLTVPAYEFTKPSWNVNPERLSIDLGSLMFAAPFRERSNATSHAGYRVDVAVATSFLTDRHSIELWRDPSSGEPRYTVRVERMAMPVFDLDIVALARDGTETSVAKARLSAPSQHHIASQDVTGKVPAEDVEGRVIAATGHSFEPPAISPIDVTAQLEKCLEIFSPLRTVLDRQDQGRDIPAELVIWARTMEFFGGKEAGTWRKMRALLSNNESIGFFDFDGDVRALYRLNHEKVMLVSGLPRITVPEVRLDLNFVMPAGDEGKRKDPFLTFARYLESFRDGSPEIGVEQQHEILAEFVAATELMNPGIDDFRGELMSLDGWVQEIEQRGEWKQELEPLLQFPKFNERTTVMGWLWTAKIARLLTAPRIRSFLAAGDVRVGVWPGDAPLLTGLYCEYHEDLTSMLRTVRYLREECTKVLVEKATRR